MKNEELNKAKKAIMTAHNLANVDDDAIVEFVSDDTAQAEQLSERLKDEKRVDYLLGRLSDSNANGDAAKLIKDIEIINRRKSKRMVVRAIASVAAIFVITFFVWNQSQITLDESITAATPELVPTLITDNGQEINLENLTETITQESYKIEKKGANVISYATTTDSMMQKVKPKYNEVKIPSKYSYKIKLEDGTDITLNAGSSLRYPTAFSGSERCVELKGEGYFSVAKSDKPFIVKINNMKVQVYGTQFNIKTLNSGVVETVLVEGSIGVSIKDKEEVKMQPNQLLVYDEQNSIIELSTTNVSRYIQWLENNFNYVDVPLEDVINDISRWYGVDFKRTTKISDLRITLFSSRDCSLEEMFDFIEMLTDVKFVKEGGKLYGIYQ